MAGSSPRHALAVVLLAGFASAASAQGRAAGRIVRLAEGDTLPVAGARIVLHRVGRADQGPVDSVVADRGGRFRLAFAAESGAAYLLSARHADIEYFSAPVSADPAAPDTAVILVVFDTSSTVPVTARHRTVLVSRPDESRARTALDWIILRNRGERTRVAGVLDAAVWGVPLPPEAQNVELSDAGAGQFSPDAIRFRGDSVQVLSPLSPGEKELLLAYRLPVAVRLLEIPLGQAAADSVHLMLEEDGARIASPGFVETGAPTMEGRTFHRWSARGAPGGVVRVELPGPRAGSGLALGILVGGLALAFVAGAVLLLRRGRPGGPAPDRSPVATAGGLTDAIARLDARYAGREGDTPAEEWRTYREERARLKAQLVRALASGGGGF